MPPPSRITASAISSSASVDTPGAAAWRTAFSAAATSAPAAAIASSSPALRWATTLRLRSPGRPIIDIGASLPSARSARANTSSSAPTASTVCRLLWQ